MPTGDEIVSVVALELTPMQPTTIALAVVVVTPGTVPEVAEAPAALEAGPSRPLAPEYRAMPPPLVTLEVKAQW
jgi:hypothetical protein